MAIINYMSQLNNKLNSVMILSQKTKPSGGGGGEKRFVHHVAVPDTLLSPKNINWVYQATF